MISAYLDASIAQTRHRAKILKGKIPNPLPTPEFHGLQRTCEQEIDNNIQLLDYLSRDPMIRHPASIRERMRVFRRTRDTLAQLEATGIAALNRHNDDDVLLNKLVFSIHQEIRYPLQPPTVSALSQNYFAIYPGMGLLVVPLAESDFLLHLPDLYHEIAHPLLVVRDNPKVEAFQHEFVRFLSSASAHFEQERLENTRTTGPRQYFAMVLNTLERSWVTAWATELFCDLFALYTLGPAYAWSHFHLTALHEADPFQTPETRMSSHPPDQARMEVLLHGLSLINREEEAGIIQARWHELLAATECKPDVTYRKACPKALLQQAAVQALRATRVIGCRVADSTASGEIHDLLNDAWATFWKDPGTYHTWEMQAVSRLRAAYCPPADQPIYKKPAGNMVLHS